MKNLRVLLRPLCWVLRHVQEGPIGADQPVENHHCRRCGVALYYVIPYPSRGRALVDEFHEALKTRRLRNKDNV